MSKTKRLLNPVTVITLALAHLMCNQAILTAPPGSTMLLFANPQFITANGGVSVVTAVLIEPAGTPVPDGTVVQFFTNLGRIDEQGKTNDGVARVNFVSDGRSGTASISAVSGATTSVGGGGSATAPAGGLSILIGSARPARVFVTADPPRITISRSTHVIATVIDANGNPIQNVPVVFTVDSDKATEFMDNAGSPRFTDSNGQADDVMRTRRDVSGGAPAKVRATVLVVTDLFAIVEIPVFP